MSDADRKVKLAKGLTIRFSASIPMLTQQPTVYTIPRLPADSFDWQRWRAFTLFYDLSIPHRSNPLIQNKARFADKAVGYCDGGSLLCRPKPGTMAVMFDHDGEWQWCHISMLEFISIFGA